MFGAPITLLSSIFTYSPDITEAWAKDDKTTTFLRSQPFKILILVGALQTICSVWLLWARVILFTDIAYALRGKHF